MIARPAYRRRIGASALLLLIVCSCQGSSGALPPASLEAEARGLESGDWERRYGALLELRAFGTSANDVVLPALRDRNEVVRKAAQHHFIGLGEKTVPYLVERLVETERDEGFFATIAGGTERSEIKSLAGTLWLTLARGTPRDRCLVIVRGFIASDSARIRAVGLFTAASMREARFVRLLEPIAEDPDPMVRERYWESLVLLLVKRSGSATDLDEQTCSLTLDLLEPELVPLLCSDQLGAVGRGQTWGGVLTRASLHADQRARFVDMVRRALNDDRLTAKGAIRVGAVLSRQYDGDERERAYRERATEILLQKSDPRASRQLSALSAFPSSACDLAALPRLLDFADELTGRERVDARGLPMLAANLLLRAMAEGDKDAAARAKISLSRWIAHSDPQLSVEAAVAHGRVLAEIERVVEGSEEELVGYEQERRELVASVTPHVDGLFDRAGGLSFGEVQELLRLFAFLGDERYLDLFRIIWSHRWDDDPEINSVVTRAVIFLSARQDKAILPHVLACAEDPEGRWHRSIRDLCAYVLTRSTRFGAFVPEFLTPERFERWVGIIEDPGLYPRTRACFFAMLEQESLSPEQRKVLADLALRFVSEPHDSNQRAKVILALANSGDRRALAPRDAMARERDHPSWIWQNLALTFRVLDGTPRATAGTGKSEDEISTKALQALVDLLEDQLATMESHDEVRFAYPNNYYSWGVEYLIYPPDVTVDFLKDYSGQDFGMDVARWRRWLSSRGDSP